MSILSSRFKKILALVTAALVVSFAGISALRADDAISDQYLPLIAQYTQGTLQAVNNLPTYLGQLSTLALAWLNVDDTQPSIDLQTTLSGYTTQIKNSWAAQDGLQQQIMQDFFGTAVTSTTLPNANDLTYEALLGIPFQGSSVSTNSPYNYIKNAAGIGLQHTIPLSGANWPGSTKDQNAYQAYYNTIAAIQTFDAYAVSQLYTDLNNGLSASQLALLNQAQPASATQAPDWFAIVKSESIGVVLRQILMYNSQTFVLLTQMLKTQKELLAATAMTNSLLVATGQTTEQILLRKATTASPKGSGI